MRRRLPNATEIEALAIAGLILASAILSLLR